MFLVRVSVREGGGSFAYWMMFSRIGPRAWLSTGVAMGHSWRGVRGRCRVENGTDLDVDHGLFSDLVEADFQPVGLWGGGGRICARFFGRGLEVGGYLCAVVVLLRGADGGQDGRHCGWGQRRKILVCPDDDVAFYLELRVIGEHLGRDEHRSIDSG